MKIYVLVLCLLTVLKLYQRKYGYFYHQICQNTFQTARVPVGYLINSWSHRGLSVGILHLQIRFFCEKILSIKRYFQHNMTTTCKYMLGIKGQIALLIRYDLHWSQLMRLWYLSYRRPAKAQASLCICAVLPEPSLFAHMKYGRRRRVRPKIKTSSPTGWLCMRVWRMSLRRTKSTIISWGDSTNLKMKHSSLPTLAVIVLPVSRCSPYMVIIDPPAVGPITGLILEIAGSWNM